MKDAVWHPTERIAVRVKSLAWQLNPDFLEEVNAHWQDVCRRHPHFFRGPVLTVDEIWQDSAGTTRIEARFSDFAHYLFSRQYLKPDHPYHVKVVNACAWVLTADGLALVGITHAESSKPGVVQPIGGASDSEDVRAGFFDPVAAASRELAEETGILPPVGSIRGYLQLKNGSVTIAVRFDLSAQWQQLAASVRTHIEETASNRELSAIYPLPPGTRHASIEHRPLLASVRALIEAPELAP